MLIPRRGISERDVAEHRDGGRLQQIHADGNDDRRFRPSRTVRIRRRRWACPFEGAHPLFAHPLRGNESLMIGFMSRRTSNSVILRSACFVHESCLCPPALPRRTRPATEAPAASADASRDVEMLMRMVRLSMPGDWSRASTGEFAEVVSPGGGRVTFHLGREASALVAAIPAGTASSPVWMGNAPATEYALAEVALTVWDTCPFPGEPLVMQITGPEGFDRDPGVTRILTTLQVTFPGDAAHCGAAIIPGQGAASAEGPQPDVLPMETDAAEAASAGDAFIEDGSGYTIYRNARYGMTIAYPGTYFTPRQPPGNWRTAAAFSSVDGRRASTSFPAPSTSGQPKYERAWRGAGCDCGRRSRPPCARSRGQLGAVAATVSRAAGTAWRPWRRVIMDSTVHDPHLRIAIPRRGGGIRAVVASTWADKFRPAGPSGALKCPGAAVHHGGPRAPTPLRSPPAGTSRGQRSAARARRTPATGQRRGAGGRRCGDR